MISPIVVMNFPDCWRVHPLEDRSSGSQRFIDFASSTVLAFVMLSMAVAYTQFDHTESVSMGPPGMWSSAARFLGKLETPERGQMALLRIRRRVSLKDWKNTAGSDLHRLPEEGWQAQARRG